LDFNEYILRNWEEKRWGRAEVQIWILLNVYRGIRKKNDGSEPKYIIGLLLMYEGNKQKNHRI